MPLSCQLNVQITCDGDNLATAACGGKFIGDSRDEGRDKFCGTPRWSRTFNSPVGEGDRFK